MQTIAIAGASGFIGEQLSSFLEQKGYNIVKINRNQLYGDIASLCSIIEGCYAVINLSGAGILRRWNKKNRELILSSRVQTTSNLVSAINRCINKPQLFISTSAVGIYDGNQLHNEDSNDFGNDFLAKVCRQWETATDFLPPHIRKIIFRLGVVVHPEGGVLKKMLLPFKLGLGGSIGNGKQAFPFIAMPDLLNAYEFCMKKEQISGVVNLVSPQMITNAEFTRSLARAIHRPSFFQIPKWLLKVLYGDAHIVLTAGQNVIPEKLLQHGFQFIHANLKEYLKMVF